jgi:3',5'-cyclic AMP phosphodiesterase CpdA
MSMPDTLDLIFSPEVFMDVGYPNNIQPQTTGISNQTSDEKDKDKTQLSCLQLMSLSKEEWANRSDDIINSKMSQYCQECDPPGRTSNVRSFIEKHDLIPHSDVAVIGDIHGNDLRLDITLKTLQQRGFLDENFHCLPGKHIVFLGDYVDRGVNSLKVLDLLMTFKIENKNQVFLLRGNHEDLNTSRGKLERYAKNDKRYFNYMQSPSNLAYIAAFYECLPVAVYLGQKPANLQPEKPQYMQFTHGLFHLHTDPSSIFMSRRSDDHLWVGGTSSFSPRVISLMSKYPFADESKSALKLRQAALLLKQMDSKMKVSFEDVYWLDIGQSFKYDRETGRTEIDAHTIKAYLTVSGAGVAKVKEIMRGHQNFIALLPDESHKIVATTIDPSGDPKHQAYIELNLSTKVRDWKRAVVVLPLVEDLTEALKKLYILNPQV